MNSLIRYICLGVALVFFSPSFKVLAQETGKTVFLVRHAEKCLEPKEDPPLTEEGAQRAKDLARFLQMQDVGSIYSTPYARTLQTAAPLSNFYELEVFDTPVTNNYQADTATKILADQSQIVVVVGHSNTTPALVNELAGTEYPWIADAEYDHVFVVRIGDDDSRTVERFRYGAPSGVVKSCSSK